MKRNDHKPYQKEVTPPQKEVCEKIEYNSTLDMVALENKLEEDKMESFMRKQYQTREEFIQPRWIFEEEDDELTDEIEDLADMESGAIACS